MANKKNTVVFGIKNVYYSVIDNGETATTYGTPKAIKGAVSLSIDIAGDSSAFYADNRVYYNSISNNGYTGSFECAKVPEEFLVDVFGQIRNEDGVLIETTNAEPKQVALMFEIDGNEKPERYVLYNVQFNRPGYSTTTITESKEPNTQSMDMTAMESIDPTILAQVLAHTTEETPDDVYNGWFTQVYRGEAEE